MATRGTIDTRPTNSTVDLSRQARTHTARALQHIDLMVDAPFPEEHARVAIKNLRSATALLERAEHEDGDG